MMKRTLTRAGAVMIGAGAVALAFEQLATVSVTAIACGFLLMVLDSNLARYGN
jgi:hypothetical protein